MLLVYIYSFHSIYSVVVCRMRILYKVKLYLYTHKRHEFYKRLEEKNRQAYQSYLLYYFVAASYIRRRRCCSALLVSIYSYTYVFCFLLFCF